MRTLAGIVGVAAVAASVLAIAPAAASVPTGTPVAPGGSVCPGVVGGPGGVAVLNLTPVEATAAGFGAVRASDAPSNNSLGAQAVSNVNFRPGSVDPNVAFASIGADGRVCFDNSPHATIHLVADQMGVMPASAYQPAAATGATRLVDTRAGAAVAPAASVCVVAVGAPGRVAVVNITPVEATGPGFGAVRASDAPSNNTLGAGAVSNVNFSVGSVDPNLAFSLIGGDGRICFDNSPHSSIHLIIDQMGSVPAGAFVPAATSGATRLMDTRIGLVVGGIGVSSVVPGAAVCAKAVGQPGDIAVVNGTPVDAAGAGFMAARSSAAASNNTLGDQAVSNWNFAPGSVDPNVAFAEIGPDGMICVDNSNHATVQMVLDQAGYLPAGQLTPATSTGAARLVDTRRGFIATPTPTPPTTTTTTTTPPGATVPGAPQDLVADPGPGTISLTWAPPTDDGGSSIDQYKLERSTGDTNDWQPLATVTGTAFSETHLSPSDVHFYRVSAHNAVGWGPPSELAAGVVQTPVAPGPIRDLMIVPGDGSVTVQWQPPLDDGGAPITGYTLLRHHSYCSSQIVEHIPSATTGISVGPLTNGEVTCIGVRPENAYAVGPVTDRQATVGAPAIPAPCSLSIEPEPQQDGTVDWHAYVDWSTPSNLGVVPLTSFSVVLIEHTSSSSEGANPTPDERSTVFQAVAVPGSYSAFVTANNFWGSSDLCTTGTVDVG